MECAGNFNAAALTKEDQVRTLTTRGTTAVYRREATEADAEVG